jgi:hypothetical protein
MLDGEQDRKVLSEDLIGEDYLWSVRIWDSTSALVLLAYLPSHKSSEA